MIIRSEELRSALAWLAVWFLAVELPAHFRLTRWETLPILLIAVILVTALWPIFTLSGTAWGGIAWWSVISILIIIGIAILLGHFDFHWSVKWLIMFAGASVMLIVSHVIEKAQT